MNPNGASAEAVTGVVDNPRPAATKPARAMRAKRVPTRRAHSRLDGDRVGGGGRGYPALAYPQPCTPIVTSPLLSSPHAGPSLLAHDKSATTSCTAEAFVSVQAFSASFPLPTARSTAALETLEDWQPIPRTRLTGAPVSHGEKVFARVSARAAALREAGFQVRRIWSKWRSVSRPVGP